MPGRRRRHNLGSRPSVAAGAAFFVGGGILGPAPRDGRGGRAAVSGERTDMKRGLRTA